MRDRIAKSAGRETTSSMRFDATGASVQKDKLQSSDAEATEVSRHTSMKIFNQRKEGMLDSFGAVSSMGSEHCVAAASQVL